MSLTDVIQVLVPSPGTSKSSWWAGVRAALDTLPQHRGISLLQLAFTGYFSSSSLDKLFDAATDAGESNLMRTALYIYCNELTSLTARIDWNNIARIGYITIAINVLLGSAHGREVFVNSPFFFGMPPQECSGGFEVRNETNRIWTQLPSPNVFGSTSLLGAFMGMSYVPTISTLNTRYMRVVELFPLHSGGHGIEGLDTAVQRDSEVELQKQIERHSRTMKEFVEVLLRAKAPAYCREATLLWLGIAARLSDGHRKSNTDHLELLPSTSALVLARVTAELAMPIFSISSFTRGLTASYLFDSLNRAPGRFFPNEEEPLEGIAVGILNEDVNTFSPRIHLFFLALRSHSLFTAPVHDQLKLHYQIIRNRGEDRERDMSDVILPALFAEKLALVTDTETSQLFLTLANASAQWILTETLRLQDDGSLDPIPQWHQLPQQLILDVFAATDLLGGFYYPTQSNVHELNYLELQHIATLLLVLLGNTQLLPKHHVHGSLVPLMEKLTTPLIYPQFANNPLFVTHALRACVQGYMVLPSDQPETPHHRLLLSSAMLVLLNDSSAVASIRSAYDHAEDTTLELLSTLMIGELTKSYDELFDALAKMRELEQENQSIPPTSNPEYSRCSKMLPGLLNHCIISLRIFAALIKNFSTAMTRNLVMQQISASLTTLLIRLAGKTAGKLKIAQPEMHKFHPQRLLSLAVECFVLFDGNESFVSFAIQSQPSMLDFISASVRITSRGLVGGEILIALQRMVQAINRALETMKSEDEIYENAPEWAQCALLFEFLTDPVAVPSKGSEFTVVNRNAIRHHLLHSTENPFDRQPLSMDKVDTFNAQPNVKASIGELKERINEWKREFNASRQ